jgi:hypothetical protein
MKTQLTTSHWDAGLRSALSLVNRLGRGGATTSIWLHNDKDPRGVSPVAVRRLVNEHTAAMTMLPPGVETTDLERLGEVDGRQRVRSRIWTEDGKSRLALDLSIGWTIDDDEYCCVDVFAERVVDTDTGLVLLTEADAPAAEDPCCANQVAGTGEDPRIRRDAQIDDANLVAQICGRIEQAPGNGHLDASAVSVGQHAIIALDRGYGDAREYWTYTFIEDHPDRVRHMIWAARHIGADPHADYLEHALDVVANYAWNDPDREELGNGFDTIEDGIDLNDVMVTYIRANPDEFFR